MIDTDKALIGLGQHISGRTVDRCGSCPYFNGDSGYGISCRDELLDDLYELLEAREEAQDAVEMAEYCERYEPTYNTEDGSM